MPFGRYVHASSSYSTDGAKSEATTCLFATERYRVYLHIQWNPNYYTHHSSQNEPLTCFASTETTLSFSFDVLACSAKVLNCGECQSPEFI